MSRSALLRAGIAAMLALAVIGDRASARSVAPPSPFVEKPAAAPAPAVSPSVPPDIDPSALFERKPEAAADPVVIRRDAAGYASQGVERLREGNHGAALVDLSESIRLDPTEPVPYCARGQVFLATGQADLAMRDFDQAVRLAPANALARRSRANASLKLNRTAAAMEDLDVAVRINPGDAETLSSRAHALFQLGRTAEADAEFERAVRVAPNPASVLWNRAELRIIRNDFAGAEADATAAIEADPATVPAFLTRAMARAMQKKWDGAIADAEANLRAFPTSGFSYHLIAMAHHAKGEHAAALADLDLALDLDRDSSPSLALRALLLAASADDRLRDGRKALEAARRACVLSGRKTHGPLHSLATAHAELGDYPAAIVAAVSAAMRPATREDRIKDARLILSALACRPVREPVAGAAAPGQGFCLGVGREFCPGGGEVVTYRLSVGLDQAAVVHVVRGLRLPLVFMGHR